VNLPDTDAPLFVALADNNTMLVSPGKDYVVPALKKIGKKDKPVLKNKLFQALLEKINDRQSLSLAAVKTDAVKDAANGLPGDVKDMIDKIQAVGGGLTLGDDVKLELVFSTKNAKDAKALKDSADAGLRLIQTFLTAFKQNNGNPGIELVVDFVKSLKLSTKEQTVVIKGNISADSIEEALKNK
jgi:hypothetical protein